MLPARSYKIVNQLTRAQHNMIMSRTQKRNMKMKAEKGYLQAPPNLDLSSPILGKRSIKAFDKSLL